VTGVVSITRVDTSADYQHAKVYVSVYGTLREKETTMAALDSASGFMRRQLRGRLETRNVPLLRFLLDETLTEGNQMLDLLDSLMADMPDSADTNAGQ
jgi:ribosome-binding factor A